MKNKKLRLVNLWVGFKTIVKHRRWHKTLIGFSTRSFKIKKPSFRIQKIHTRPHADVDILHKSPLMFITTVHINTFLLYKHPYITNLINEISIAFVSFSFLIFCHFYPFHFLSSELGTQFCLIDAHFS